MDEKHPKNIDKRPKRRKDRDNPYEIFTVGINTDNPHYYTSFVDNHGVQMCIEIQKELFDVLNQFELDDLTYLNEMDRHYEKFELSESSLNKRAVISQESVEEIVSRELDNEALYKAIFMLSEMQRKRLILYYFCDMTYQQIADLEGCTYQTIQKSMEKSKNKIKKFLI